MKRYMLYFVSALFFVGCGTHISEEALQKTGLKGAPSWVIEGGVGLYSGIGDAPIIDGNVNFARTEATAAARAEVSKQIGVKVTSYLNKQTDRKNKTLNEQVAGKIGENAQKYLTNTQPAGFWINDSGTRVYVLVKLADKEVEAIKKNLMDNQIDPKELEAFANEK
ncbi:hypothetical protein BBW65_01670 [Helicobacter enhydrae]|uniref:POU-specific domain-containing protein n=1 Tax=Helicobacter enhydrae TaxID=222136 RepID=A0A1B1U4F4_9HELI|nr:hypothetical protein [Helicobacter enhydrae]ANV97592.1 hypothetical protein BBW65_01670 [Helicobacter enhydrae]